MLGRWIVLLSLIGLGACAPSSEETSSPPPPAEPSGPPAELPALDGLPHWSLAAFEDTAFSRRYEIHRRLNPFFHTGDFDGDGAGDLAVWVRERASGKQGVVVVRRADASRTVFGAGRDFGHGSDDWDWVGLWKVDDRATATPPIPRRGDYLVVIKPEAASAAISWDGGQWVWTQLGD